jgi:RsmE family RNA methyltransferase
MNSPSIRCNKFVRKFHQTTALRLNRFLFDPSEIDENSENGCPTITLPKSDYRTIHAAKILGLLNDQTLRAGIIQDADIHAGNSTSKHAPSLIFEQSESRSKYAGLITDEAPIQWIPEGKIKKAQPTKNGDPPGSLQITLNSLKPIVDEISDIKPRVSVILALPRPLALGRLLPMMAQMGVEHLVLTQAKKVPKDYFGSHLFRKPMEIRKALIEGLCQAADVQIPTVTVVKRLKPFMEDDLENMFPKDKFARVIAHPQRKDGKTALRMNQISFPDSEAGTDRRIVLAVGPEGGWAEPYELDMFQDHGFQQVTLGSRILRSDVAVISLLSLAADACLSDNDEEN